MNVIRTRSLTSLSWCILLLAWIVLHPDSARAFAPADVPNPRSTHDGWVTDQAQVLGVHAAIIETRLAQLHASTGAEVAVVILPSIGDAVPRQFATALFKLWGIGHKDVRDGVLVLHVIDQRRLEIETGYDQEGALPDAKCAWLIQEVAFPLFKQEQLALGHLALSAGLELAIRDPSLGHDALVSAASQSVQGLPQAPYTPAIALVRSPRGEPFQHQGLLWLALIAIVPAKLLRDGGRRALYRDKAARYAKGWVPLIAGLLFAGAASIGMLAADDADTSRVCGWVTLALLALDAGYLTISALIMFVRSYRRYRARVCPHCGKPMHLLNEESDDEHLQHGQRTEEQIGSVDYDVWLCRCDTMVLAYNGPEPALACTKCSFKTDKLQHSRVIEEATYDSSGLRENHFLCAHCSAARTEQEVIPRKERSSSSGSSGGGSSSGGSSFSGGSSGGGGAGGSY
ncbi:MAG TPA: TPM domain-containing protein [Polyangiales bacterium]